MKTSVLNLFCNGSSKMLQRACLLITAAASATCLAAREPAATDARTESLQTLQELRTQNNKRLGEINDAIAKKMEERSSSNFETDVTKLKAVQRELILRRDFVDRMVLQFDKNFHGGDVRDFVQKALAKMAKTDAVSMDSDSGLWKFLKYSAEAVQGLPEKGENVLSFLEDYMNRSVSNPVGPKEFLSQRNFTNGAKSEAGRPMNSAEAGAVADRHLRELQQPATPAVSRQN